MSLPFVPPTSEKENRRVGVKRSWARAGAAKTSHKKRGEQSSSPGAREPSPSSPSPLGPCVYACAKVVSGGSQGCMSFGPHPSTCTRGTLNPPALCCCGPSAWLETRVRACGGEDAWTRRTGSRQRRYTAGGNSLEEMPICGVASWAAQEAKLGSSRTTYHIQQHCNAMHSLSQKDVTIKMPMPQPRGAPRCSS